MRWHWEMWPHDTWERKKGRGWKRSKEICPPGCRPSTACGLCAEPQLQTENNPDVFVQPNPATDCTVLRENITFTYHVNISALKLQMLRKERWQRMKFPQIWAESVGSIWGRLRCWKFSLAEELLFNCWGHLGIFTKASCIARVKNNTKWSHYFVCHHLEGKAVIICLLFFPPLSKLMM